MEYLPTLGEQWPHSRGNGLVNIPYIHGASGILHGGFKGFFRWESDSIISTNVGKYSLGGETSHIFYFHRKLGKIPNLPSIFFKGVETTN